MVADLSIPFLDLQQAYRELKEELDEAAGRVLSSGHYVMGDEAAAFEADFARYTHTQHCVGVGSGLGALQLILLALGVGRGDEVIVPAHTFIATWLAVTHTGAVPVPCEPLLTTCNIDPDQVEKLVTANTRAIVVVHLYGQPAEMARILELGDQLGIPVVEDAAQAHGARYGLRPVGGLGTGAAWSFYPAKNLGAYGDGGAVTTNDAQLAGKVRRLRNYGSVVKYEHSESGFNCRLDELQAAFLRVKLAYLDDWNDRRRRIADCYFRGLAESGLTLPAVVSAADPAWHLFVIRCPDRDELRRRLETRGVGTQVHYPVPVHLQGAYHGVLGTPRQLPRSEQLASEVLSLPIGPHLLPEDARRVVSTILESL